MPDWAWVLCDGTGSAVAEFANARQLAFQAQRNRGRQGTVTIDHASRETGLLFTAMRNGTPQLRVYRDGALRLSAYLVGVTEQVDDEGQDELVAVFKDPFGRLLGDGSNSGRFLPAALDRTATDQGAIAWALIAAGNADGANGDTGLRQGAIQASKPRDRHYDAGQNIGQAIVNLTEVIDGFDFDILPLDPTANGGKLGEFVVYARQGTDLPDVLFGFGSRTMANVKAVGRTWSPPVNKARITNAEGTASTDQDAASRAKHGTWEESYAASSVVETDTLTEKASDRLRPEWVRVVTFTPDPVSAPQPFDHYWIGDTPRFEARQDYLREIITPRVDAITVTLDANRSEEHQVTVTEAR